MSNRSKRINIEQSNDEQAEHNPYASYDDQDSTEPSFERIRSNTGKAASIKSDRRQQAKEWGRMHAKFHKQRKNKKP